LTTQFIAIQLCKMNTLYSWRGTIYIYTLHRAWAKRDFCNSNM